MILACLTCIHNPLTTSLWQDFLSNRAHSHEYRPHCPAQPVPSPQRRPSIRRNHSDPRTTPQERRLSIDPLPVQPSTSPSQPLVCPVSVPKSPPGESVKPE